MATDKSDYQHVFAKVFTKAEELLANAEKNGNALNQYLNSWDEIAELAAELNNFSLQDVILLFIEGSNEAFASPGELTAGHWELLRKWDTLFEDYIKNPDSAEKAAGLIECLGHPLLATELSEADTEMLLDGFTLIARQLQGPANPAAATTMTASCRDKILFLFDEAVLNFEDIFSRQSIDDELTLSENLKLYLQDWQDIAGVIENEAQEEPLSGLLDIVLLFIEINTLLLNQQQVFSDEQRAAIGTWHDLFDDYIKAQESKESGIALVGFLANPVWPEMVTPEDEKMLLEGLGIHATAAERPPVAPSPKKTLNVWQQAELLLKSATADFKEVVAGDEEKLPAYQQSWRQIADTFEKTDSHHALLDVILLFTEVSEPVFELSIILADSQVTLFKKWHSLFDSYLKSHGNKTLAMSLVKCLGDPAWPGAITLDDEKMLLMAFDKNPETAVVVTDTANTRKNADGKISGIPEKTPLPQAPEPYSLWKEVAGLLQEASTRLKMAVDQQIDGQQQGFCQNLKLYAEKWRQIGSAFESCGEQEAMLDVVQLFAEVSGVDERQDLTAEHLGLLNKWQKLFFAYLENRDDLPGIEPLLRWLQNPAWPDAIAEEDIDLLRESFSIPAQAQETLIADEAAMPEILPESQPAEDRPEMPQQLAAIKPGNVWEKIRPVFTKATAELKAIIDYQIDSNTEAFNSSIQTYQQHWQQVCDILETEQSQPGLLDVVMLFAEISPLGFENLESKQLSQLNRWHQAFGEYLAAEGHRQIAIELISCLCNPAWPESLTEEDGDVLLEGFANDDDKRLNAAKGKPPLTASIQEKKEYHPAWDKISSFFEDSGSNIDTLSAAINEERPQESIENLQQYASYWTIIAEIISDEGNDELQSLCDVSFLYADNCIELTEEKRCLTAGQLPLLQQWHDDFRLYLQNVSEARFLIPLIKILENSAWLRPLTLEDREMLLAMMLAENEEEMVFADDDAEELLMFNDDLFAAEAEPPESASVQESFMEMEDGEENDLFAEQDVLDNDDADIASGLFADDDVLEEETCELFADEVSENGDEEHELTVDNSTEGEDGKEMTEPFATESGEDDKDRPATTEDVPEAFTEEPVAEQPPPAFEIKTTQVNPELIGMVSDEFILLVKDLAPVIIDISNEESFKRALKEHHFKFDNLAKACNTIGLLGLESVFGHLSQNMRCRRESDSSFTESQRVLFKDCLPLIQGYIGAVTDRDNAEALVRHLQSQDWKQPLDKSRAESLKEQLSALIIASQSPQLETRKTRAEVSDVSLELPEDVNQDLLNSLLDELPTLTANFSEIIQKIISKNRSIDYLLEAQRIAHTLKGSGNIVGISGIAVLTHHLEEILEYLTEKRRFPTQALSESLLEATDCLEMMCEIILSGEWHAPDQALQVLQKILDWANQIATSGLPEENAPAKELSTLPFEPETDTTGVIQPGKTKTAESVPTTRVSSELVDNLLRMTGEGSILSEQFKERINRFSGELKTLNELTWHMQTLVSELDQSVNIQSYHTRSLTDSGEFDALEMEQYNELHTAASRLAEVATDIREINIGMDEQLIDLKYLMMDEEAVQKENQEMVQSIRMVPASTIASRCHRIVRQACRMTGKEVELEINGGDLLIDSEILNDMVDPLMHLLRNSVDHGIEPKHIRQRNNKNETGRITLEFNRKGNYAVISCKDDGGGLSSGNILQTAIKKGLITVDQKLTEAEIHKLILIPGFSTRSVATQVSGRGIGMDAIQTKISSLQGQMSLFSVRGEGLTIEITIPLTLSSMLSLLVRSNDQTMAISNRGLQKIHHPDDCELIEHNGKELICQIAGEQYPAKYFSELLGMSLSHKKGEKLPALRIADEIGKTRIVFVDELLGYRDLLVKNMGHYIPHVQGVTGASILGNGDVAPVIDLVEMLHNAAKYDFLMVDAAKGLIDSVSGLPVALVVDDSLSARRAVAMLLEDSGIDVETAIDGMDAIKQIEKKMPDILVVDLEMPRMNGIELTAHVKGRKDTAEIPVIMITSRATEKHRKQAEAAGVTEFMTKPFSEDDLMNNVRRLMRA